MSRVERDFRRNLTRRVRAIVQASPEMHEEWQRRNPRWPWWRIALAMPVWIFLSLIAMGIAFGMLPWVVSMGVLHPHVMRLYGRCEAVLIPTPDYALAPMTLALSAVVFFVSGLGSFVLGPGKELGRLAYFPIPDRDHLQRSLRGMVILGSLLAACLVPAYAGIAAFERLSIWQIAALVLCVCLQLVYGLALVVAISPHIRYYSWQQAVLLFGAIGLMILALCANGFSEHLWRHWHTLAAVVLATPIGWTNAAIAYGVIGGHWWGWLFLLPLPLAVAAALRWLRRGYAIREVLIGPDGAATPVFEFGLANSVTATAAAPPRDSDLAETASQDDGGAMAAAAHSRKHILSGEALAPLDWSKLGFIERYVGSHLTDRERATVEHVCHRRLSWTRAWWIAAAAGIPLMAILLAARFDLPEPGKLKPDLSIVMWLFSLAIGEALAHFRLSDLVARCPHHHGSPCHPLFPVDQKATVAALVRVYWLRLPQWLPLCLVAVIILAVWRPDWPIFVVVNLLLALAVTRLAIGVLARLPFGGGTTLSGRIISWRRVAAMIPIALPWFTGAFGVWFYFHWIVPIASLSVLMLAIWITNRHVDRHFLLVADFDVLSPATRRSSSLLQNPA